MDTALLIDFDHDKPRRLSLSACSFEDCINWEHRKQISRLRRPNSGGIRIWLFSLLRLLVALVGSSSAFSAFAQSSLTPVAEPGFRVEQIDPSSPLPGDVVVIRVNRVLDKSSDIRVSFDDVSGEVINTGDY